MHAKYFFIVKYFIFLNKLIHKDFTQFQSFGRVPMTKASWSVDEANIRCCCDEVNKGTACGILVN